jgi:hypothetical protein
MPKRPSEEDGLFYLLSGKLTSKLIMTIDDYIPGFVLEKS